MAPAPTKFFYDDPKVVGSNPADSGLKEFHQIISKAFGQISYFDHSQSTSKKSFWYKVHYGSILGFLHYHRYKVHYHCLLPYLGIMYVKIVFYQRSNFVHYQRLLS